MEINGSFTAIAGKSGCGKSTLIEIILGIRQIDSGNITFLTDKGEKYNNCKIGYIQQFASVYDGSLINNIFYFKKKITSKDFKILNELFELFDFNVILENIFKEDILRDIPLEECYQKEIFKRQKPILSGGQQQRLQIIRVCAQALIYNKNIIISDELTSALDSQSANLVWNGLYTFSKKYNIMIINFIHPNILKEYSSLFNQKIIINNENNIRDFQFIE